jgi:RNA polymerase sigma-70 factor (ECF subfamily)
MTRVSDEDLVARCLAGSDEAFADLVDSYKNLVFGVISQVVSDRNRVEDLAQDVFLKVHRGLSSFRGDSKLSTWIYRIVLNVCTDATARERTWASLDDRGADGILRYEAAVRDAAFNAIELRDELERAIATLPVQQRFLISAHYFGGQQYQELADILNIPIGTVKTQLHRAKARLRVLLEQGREARGS